MPYRSLREIADPRNRGLRQPAISRVFKAVKVSSMIGINVRRREGGELWQDRFFDRALRTMKEYNETLEYIHLNPARPGLVEDTRDWRAGADSVLWSLRFPGGSREVAWVPRHNPRGKVPSADRRR